MTATPAGNGNGTAPLLEIDNVSKYFGNVIALKDVSAVVNECEVTCVLGDNGAGKSTFIKILSGVHHEDEGEIRMEGEKVSFGSPRAAKERGIATVFQDLSTVPLMSIWRNFFLGSEPTKGKGPLRRVDVKFAQETMVEQLGKMGIDIRDPAYPVGDRFVVLNRGRLMGNWEKGDISRDELIKMMSGGAELDALSHELERVLDEPLAP